MVFARSTFLENVVTVLADGDPAPALARRSAVSMLARGKLLVYLGRVNEAREALLAARAAGATLNDAAIVAHATNRLGVVARHLGDLDGAVAAYRQAKQLAERSGLEDVRALAIGNLAGAWTLRGSLDEAVKVLEAWVAKTPWIEFLAADPACRSSTSICLKLVADWFLALGDEDQAALTKRMAALLEQEGAAYDINGYRSAPPGLRIWGGATVEAADLAALLPWLEWAFARLVAERAA